MLKTSLKYRKYLVNTDITISKKKPSNTFYELASKHIMKTGAKKEDIARNIDKILYGKK